MYDYNNLLLTIIALVGILSISFVWWILYTFCLVKVEGISMLPTLEDGEFCLIKEKKFAINEGDIYVFEVEGYGYVIKRLKHVKTALWNGEKSYFIQGDNTDYSIDSRDFGYLPEKSVKGKVFKLKIWRKQNDKRNN